MAPLNHRLRPECGAALIEYTLVVVFIVILNIAATQWLGYAVQDTLIEASISIDGGTSGGITGLGDEELD